MKALVICKHSSIDPESKVCHTILNPNIKIKYSWKNTLTQKELQNIDLVIAIGGEGARVQWEFHFSFDASVLGGTGPVESV